MLHPGIPIATGLITSMRPIFLKDMAYHKARVGMTVVGIVVLIMLILLLGGIMNGLRWQAKRYPEFTGADVWVSRERSGGVFVGFSMLNSEYVEPQLSQRGPVFRGKGYDPATPVSPLIFAQVLPLVRGKEKKAVVVGYKIDQLGGPRADQLVEGRLFEGVEGAYSPEQQAAAEVIVDETMGLEVGETLQLAGEQLKIVGKVRNIFFVFDTPMIFMDLRLAQATVLEDSIYVNTFLLKTAPEVHQYVVETKGVGSQLEEYLIYREPDLEADLVRPITKAGLVQVNDRSRPYDYRVKQGDRVSVVRYTPEEIAKRVNQLGIGLEAHTTKQTIRTILQNYVDEPMKGVQFLRVMLWVAAGLIVTMITYVTTLEKTQELGVMKAIGASNRYVLALTLNQVLLISVAGLTLGIGLAYLAVNAFPIFVLISVRETALVASVSFLVCVAGGFFAARRALKVDPMIAFRGEI